MNDDNFYCVCQHGFRKHGSVSLSCCMSLKICVIFFDNGDPYNIIYFDLKIAFDQVSHRRLAVKL